MSFRNFQQRQSNQIFDSPPAGKDGYYNTASATSSTYPHADNFGHPPAINQPGLAMDTMGFNNMNPKGGFGQQESSSSSRFEANIKAVIERLQVERQRFRGNNIFSGDISTNREFLQTSKCLIEDGQSLFRDWQVTLASEPLEKQRKRLALEKLQLAFDEEQTRIRQVQLQVEGKIQEIEEASVAANSPSSSTMNYRSNKNNSRLPAAVELRSHLDDEGDERAKLLFLQGDDNAHLHGDDRADASKGFNDSAFSNGVTTQSRMAEDTENGLKRIAGQMRDVQKLFTDMAGLVKNQDAGFQSIGESVNDMDNNCQVTLDEINKTERRAQNSSERGKLFLGGALIFLVVILWVSDVINCKGSSGNNLQQPQQPRWSHSAYEWMFGSRSTGQVQNGGSASTNPNAGLISANPSAVVVSSTSNTGLMSSSTNTGPMSSRNAQANGVVRATGQAQYRQANGQAQGNAGLVGNDGQTFHYPSDELYHTKNNSRDRKRQMERQMVSNHIDGRGGDPHPSDLDLNLNQIVHAKDDVGGEVVGSVRREGSSQNQDQNYDARVHTEINRDVNMHENI